MLKCHKGSMFLFLSLVVSLLSIGQSYGVEQNQPKAVKLKVVSSPYLSYAPFFIAYEEGYFTEQGIQVDFLNMVDANQAMPSLISGDLDVMAYMILPGPLNAMARGAKIKFVADKGHLSPSACVYTALLVRRALVESGRLSSPFDLKDLRVAMYEGPSPMGYFMEKILDQGGLTLNDIKNVFVPVSARVEAFERGTIDATLFSEPWVTHLVQGGHAVIRFPIQQLVPNFQLAYLMYGPSLLEKKTGRRKAIYGRLSAGSETI